jgi:hypothetical protein
MNDEKKPRNRIRPTTAQAKAERDEAQRALNALGAKLMTAYFGILAAFIVGLMAGLAL